MTFDDPRFRELLKSAAASLPALARGTGWDALRSFYNRPAESRPVLREEPQPDRQFRRARALLERRGGHRVAGLFLRPHGDGPFPCALLLHALSSDKETMSELFGRALAEQGVASLALDAHLHGERRADRSEALAPHDYLDLARETVVEYRLALDALENRPDIIADRVGLLGYSLGGVLGCILAGVDERVRASVLMVAGDLVRLNMPRFPAPVRRIAEPVCAANFASHISPRPVLFINGKRDPTMSPAAATLLHEAAREPKEIRWVDAGHRLPEQPAQDGVDWLVTQQHTNPHT
jgi:uncharacterized protein